MTKVTVLDRLLEHADAAHEIHPHLKRMILAATQSALLRIAPDSFYKKCQGAAAAIFMILRTLRIRSTICGGTVSWLYGGIDEQGVAWQSRCGFWSQNPELPTPHAWVVTEYGGLVDLTCSYFHHIFDAQRKGLRSRDVLPMIWMKTENLNALPALRYNATTRFDNLDLDNCDDLARSLVGHALTSFWGQPWIDAVLQPGVDPESFSSNMVPNLENAVLDGPQSLEQLRHENGWVARNSQLPSALTLAMSPSR
jgi:hypothetical protein